MGLVNPEADGKQSKGEKTIMAPLKAEKESSPLQTEGTQPPEDAGQGPKQRPS